MNGAIFFKFRFIRSTSWWVGGGVYWDCLLKIYDVGFNTGRDEWNDFPYLDVPGG